MTDLVKILAPVARKFKGASTDESMVWQAEKNHILAVLNNNKTLLECTPESIQAAALQAASMGLTMNPSVGHCYFIPRAERTKAQGESWADYNSNVKQIAYASPSYRGLIHSACRSGSVLDISAEVVFQGDEFQYYGPLKEPHYIMSIKAKREEDYALGVFVVARLTHGLIKSMWMDTKDILAAKSKSKNQGGLMWTTFWTEGYKKAAIRRAYKTLNISNPQLDNALNILNTFEGIAEINKGDAIEVISEEQCDKIKILIESKAPDDRIEAWENLIADRFGVGNYTDIPAADFDNAMEVLKTAKSQK